MTCTIAILDGHVVVMASDSASTTDDGALVVRRSDSKVWRASSCELDLLVGYSGTFTYGVWVRHAFSWPWRPLEMDAAAWLTARVQPALLSGLKARFGDKLDDNWTLLVGVRERDRPARLFTLFSNGDVEEAAAPYAAIGLGAPPALGCLATLDALGCTAPAWERLEHAMRIAEMFHSSVRSPVHIEALI